MTAYPNLATLLNPLTPIRMAAEGARIVKSKASEMAADAREGAIKGAAAGVMAAVPGFGPLGMFGPLGFNLADNLPGIPDLKGAGKDLNDLAKKALIGEVVLVGGVVALAAIAAWYLSKSPEARARVWDVGSTGAKLLVTKGMG